MFAHNLLKAISSNFEIHVFPHCVISIYKLKSCPVFSILKLLSFVLYEHLWHAKVMYSPQWLQSSSSQEVTQNGCWPRWRSIFASIAGDASIWFSEVPMSIVMQMWNDIQMKRASVSTTHDSPFWHAAIPCCSETAVFIHSHNQFREGTFSEGK